MKKKICIVYSLYNENITKKMFERAVKLLKSKGVTSIKILKVPGSFEIPQVLSRVINKYDGFIVIGCIIKGKTKNFDLICSAITNGIMDLSIKNKKPIGNGLITSFNEKQALQRLNNGKEAAQAVLDVLKIF
jgi:6,7-dimethyl-8-ribityllumazine synthase|tara:strand:+ start:177 stop:572 length:396 start_codon:yes stop_codon:yes gene_type:complete